MTKTKYMMSGGLAFAEESDMKKLRRHSLKGWHVRDFSFMGYTLEKGESKDYIYTLDFRTLKEEEEAEYFELFHSSGWKPVASEDGFHLFRALPGTKPIYSDPETSLEKYDHLNTNVNKVTIPLCLITGLFWGSALLSSGQIRTILIAIAAILSVFALPAAWTAIAAYSNKLKVKGKMRTSTALKVLPVFLLVSGVIISVLIFVPDRGVQIIGSLIKGGVIGLALPMGIWLIMSLYSKVSKR